MAKAGCDMLLCHFYCVIFVGQPPVIQGPNQPSLNISGENSKSKTPSNNLTSISLMVYRVSLHQTQLPTEGSNDQPGARESFSRR